MKADKLTGIAFFFFMLDIFLVAFCGLWIFYAMIAFVVTYLILYYRKQKSRETEEFLEKSFQFFAPTSSIVLIGFIIYMVEIFR